MGFVTDCNNLKNIYSESELINRFYNHYYYMVDKYYLKNNGNLNREEIEICVYNSIVDYIKNDIKKNPSCYIHNKLNSLECSHKSKSNKKNFYELQKRAYLGDFDARKYMFMKHIDKVENKAIEIFENSFDTIDLESIVLFMYQDMWDFVNRYYDKKNNGSYFSTKFSNQLASTISKVNRNIDFLKNENKVKKKGRV